MAGTVTHKQAERMASTIEKQRDKLKEGARLGSSALITALGGGAASGWLKAKYPTVGNVSSTGLGGTLLVIGGLSGVFDNYSDEVVALGSGMLAVAIADEAAAYFSS